MTPRPTLVFVLAAVCLLAGCPEDGGDPDAGAGARGGGAGAGTSGGGAAGRAGSSGGGGTSGSSGGGGVAGTGGTAGGDGSGCGPNTAIPASCLLCDDGSCGAPRCVGGKFDHFECADEDGSGGAAGGGDAGSGDPGDDACDLIDCAPGTHCELIEVQCIRAPCPAQPECIAN